MAAGQLHYQGSNKKYDVEAVSAKTVNQHNLLQLRPFYWDSF